MSGKPKPITYNCATCGIFHINKYPSKLSRFCSRACTSKYKSVMFEISKPEVKSFSGLTRLIADKFIVNEEYFDWLNQYKWQTNSNGYAVIKKIIDGKYKTVRMHRLLMNAVDGQFIDHINRNKADNRLDNLRFTNHSENGLNTIASDKAKYYTYDKFKHKWAVQKGGNHYGRFNTEQEAIDYVEKYIKPLKEKERVVS